MIKKLEEQLIMLQSRADEDNELAEILVELSQAWIDKDIQNT